MAVDERTALAISLSPGQAHDGVEGRKLLERVGSQKEHRNLVMDRAYEGNQTRRTGPELGIHPGSATAASP